ncbi:unnamed protein product, partial [Aureobasidium pullulans]
MRTTLCLNSTKNAFQQQLVHLRHRQWLHQELHPDKGILPAGNLIKKANGQKFVTAAPRASNSSSKTRCCSISCCSTLETGE